MKKETITGISKQYEPILIYLVSLLGFIFSFLKDEVDKEVRWTYNQAGAIFMVYAGIGVVSSSMVFIPVVGWALSLVLWMAEVAVLVFTIIALIKACQGEHYEIPLLADLAKAIWKWEEPVKKDTKKIKDAEIKSEKKTAKK